MNSRTYVAVLLGGEAGLRAGEIMALEWTDVDFVKNQVCVERSNWKGHVTSPKVGGGATCRSPRRWARRCGRTGICAGGCSIERDGRPLTQKVLQCIVRAAARRAGLKPKAFMSCAQSSRRAARNCRRTCSPRSVELYSLGLNQRGSSVRQILDELTGARGVFETSQARR